VHNFCSSIFQSLATVGLCMPRASGVASAHDLPVVIALLQRHLQGIHGFDLYCPRVAPSVGVVSCTYHQAGTRQAGDTEASGSCHTARHWQDHSWNPCLVAEARWSRCDQAEGTDKAAVLVLQLRVQCHCLEL